jgi:hypothetical protein
LAIIDIFKTAKYYDSIDNCPIGIFQKVLSGGDSSMLCYEGKPNKVKQHNAWELIFNEYVKEFGLPEQYTRYLAMMVRVINLYDIAYNQNKRSNITKAKILELKANLELNNDAKISFSVTLAQVSKEMGFKLDQNTTTVREFYSYVSLLNQK